MIDIRKIEDVKVTDKLVNEFQLKFAQNDLLLGAFSDGAVIGFLQYETSSDTLKIKFISCFSKDFALADGLIKIVTLPLEYEQSARSLGFRLNGNIFELKLSEYSNHCHM